MSTQNAPKPPPAWLFKNVINPTMKFVLRSPLHGILSKGLAILSFSGRKSGKRYATPVAYHVADEDTVMIFTRAPWWRNLTNGEPVTLRIKGRDIEGIPQVIRDNDVVWDHIDGYLTKYDGNTRRVGIMLGSDATDEDVRAAARDMLAIQIQLKK